jgi:hypothetical protein
VQLLPILEITMRAKIVLCLVMLATATGQGDCSTNQAAPAGQKSVGNFYPLKAGSKWHYRLEVDGQSATSTMQVTGVEKIDGLELFCLEARINGEVVATEHIASDKAAVFRHRFNGEALEKPICLIRYPFKAGDAWEDTCQVGDGVAKLTAKVGAEIELQVPAGKFKAFPVRIELHDPEHGSLVTTYWFALDVGIVRQTVETPDLQITMELEKLELVR